jgi:ABC-type transporter MlaC component
VKPINFIKMAEVKNAEKQVNKQDLLVSREEFMEYLDVQEMGAYNMLDPRAREMTTLDKEQWMHIIENYAYLKELYEIA